MSSSLERQLSREIIASLACVLVAACTDSPGGGPLPSRDAGSSPPSANDPGARAVPIAVSVASRYSCALLESGGASCWGYNLNGQMCHRNDRSDAPRPVGSSGDGDLEGAIDLVAGDSHLCLILAGGRVDCCGASGDGQLDGNPSGGGSTPKHARTPEGAVLEGVTKLALGSRHTCAILADSSMLCWGRSGISGVLEPIVPVRIDGVLATGATAIEAGVFHTCAVVANGQIICWGDNAGGSLGSGERSVGNLPPVGVVNENGERVSGATELAAGFSHTCARFGDGHVECWGLNTRGQIGSGVLSDLEEPGRFSAGPVLRDDGQLLDRVTAIAAGVDHTCALIEDGSVACWGLNAHGQLGNGTTNPSPSAVQVAGIDSAIAIAAGGMSNDGSHSCALLEDRRVLCWGNNSRLQVGQASTAGGFAALPVEVEGL